MKRWVKFIASAIFACFFVIISNNLLQKVLSFAVCTLLMCNQATVYSLGNGDKVNAALSSNPNFPEVTDVNLKPTYPLEIAAPPIIRDAPVDLQQSFPGDFNISRQTPNSTGRNEILFVSPSTGTEQRFEINLPGTGAFQLYSAKFNKVSISDPNRLIKNGSTLTATQAQQKLSSFEIKFNNNIVSDVILADGTKAEVSDTEVVVKQSDGQVIETLFLSQDKSLKDNQILAQVKSNTKFLAQADSGCQTSIQQNLYQVATQVQSKSNNLKSLESNYGYLLSWALTFSDKALEDSLVDNSRNITIQEIACTAPVQCQQVQASGGSEVRTDLFELPPGTNRRVTFDYEFYDIPDRVEIYYNGEIKAAYPQPVVPLENTETPDPTWLANGNGQLQIAIDDDKAQFIGIKIIGNDDEQTKWDYTVNCTGEAIAEEPTCDNVSQPNLQSQSPIMLPKQPHIMTNTLLALLKNKQNSSSLFETLWKNYPFGNAEQVKKDIGGNVNASWVDNTCAIRMSKALNYSLPDKKIPFINKDVTIKGGDNLRYIFRVKDFINYITGKFGKPNIQVEIVNNVLDKSSLKDKQGIIVFEVNEWTNATGHATLWNGIDCADKCYFDEANKISLWIIK
ncbi:hypothetical protein Sta7437_2870 [Stanieria cyanosphaera PCC 7437]|uniref:Uncharacterized protein n=1 Tax=Stanieria cyanosphaera (strain ATCC 29371 / PCC 7437) TaxID=111780 RepID=K9XUW0_STAC7|nr:type VI secretion system amidase effector protein Tae4 [Stanieria cyanosphaera]AFZ36390.1 hypothetical protein Sta7437_2870 [Stanieria cyanosphaera PCC 7437]